MTYHNDPVFNMIHKNKCNGKCWIQHWCPINKCVCCAIRYFYDDSTFYSNFVDHTFRTMTTTAINTPTSTTTCSTIVSRQNRKKCKCACHKHVCEKNGCEYGYKQVSSLCCEQVVVSSSSIKHENHNSQTIITTSLPPPEYIATCILYTCPICRDPLVAHPFWYFEFRNGMCHLCFLAKIKK